MDKLKIIIDNRKEALEQWIYTDIYLNNEKIDKNVTSVEFGIEVEKEPYCIVTYVKLENDEIVYEDVTYKDYTIITVNNWKEYLGAYKQ